MLFSGQIVPTRGMEVWYTPPHARIATRNTLKGEHVAVKAVRAVLKRFVALIQQADLALLIVMMHDLEQ